MERVCGSFPIRKQANPSTNTAARTSWCCLELWVVCHKVLGVCTVISCCWHESCNDLPLLFAVLESWIAAASTAAAAAAGWIEFLDVERMGKWWMHWTQDLKVWGSILIVPVMCKSLGQTLNPDHPKVPSSNGYQVEWQLVLCEWLQLQKIFCILPREMRLKECSNTCG